MDYGLVGAICAIASLLFGALWKIHATLDKRFDDVSAKFEHVDTKVDGLENSIVTRLDSHEKQDMQRFSNVSDGIWDLRVRMAAREGVVAVTNNPNNNK